MKIVTVLGSPRPGGNSTAIAHRFNETARELGAEVLTFALNKLEYKACQACMSCKTGKDRCILEDDLTQVLDAVCKSDILVLATPIYFADVSSQTKSFIDRCYSLLVADFQNSSKPSRLASDKSMVLIQTQGAPQEELFGDIFPKCDMIFNLMGFENNRLIRGCGLVEPDDIKNCDDVMALAEKTAKEVMV
jgi:multimeric flavodoxin WrbA